MVDRKRTIKPRTLAAAALIVVAGALFNASQPARGVLFVRSLMTPAEFKASGLEKLTPTEMAALDRWIEKFATIAAEAGAASAPAAAPAPLPERRTYTVTASIDDRTFTIDEETLTAKTRCTNVTPGDHVSIVHREGSAGAEAVTFLNLRTGELCDATPSAISH